MSIFTLHRYKTKLAADRFLAESAQPTEGIYYVVRLPKGWELIAHRFDEFPEEWNHDEVWREDVAPLLARTWTKIVSIPSDKLTKMLLDHYSGFPRGRIGNAGMHWIVRHGNNIERYMGLTRNRILRAFELTQAEWEFDQHEQCLQEDVDAVRDILKLKERWQAAKL